ncbi:MAG: hypothetical protein M0P94_01360 [Candidatus Absconditabacterales bacterium]|nr:hypothetical protein [Candidatus Absconditabacterales bacterium]
MPTDENLTNTNSSSNKQTGSTQTNTNNDEKLDFLDIDLNLDGLDIINEKGKEENTETNIQENINEEPLDQLDLGEEEHIKTNVQENTETNIQENINEEPLDQLDLGEEEHIETNVQENTETNIQENINEEPLDQLDLGEEDVNLETENNSDVNTNDRLEEENKKFEEIIGKKEITENVQKESIDLSGAQNLDLPFVGEEKNTNNTTENNMESGVQLDNLSGLFDEEKKENPNTENKIEQDNNKEIIQNVSDYIPSDTGETFETKTGYVPNENSFAQVQNLLESNQTGNIDLSTLEQNTSSNSNQNVENNTNQNNGLNLNEIISNPTNTESINIEQIIQSSQFEPIVIEEKQETKENIKENISEIPEGAKVISSTEFSKKKKKKGSGLKIFILIILLIAGGFMLISKMYPEETKQVILAIKNGNNADIDYEDDEDENILDEINNEIYEELEEDILNDELEENILNDELEEEIDPNSLAGQLEVENILDESIETEDNSELEHGSAEVLDKDDDEFNAFENIDNMFENTENANQKLLDQLEEYSQLGESFNVWGRENNNSTAMKYGLFIKNHSERLLNEIENSQEINTTEIEEYIEKFDTYIQKLNTLTGE